MRTPLQSVIVAAILGLVLALLAVVVPARPAWAQGLDAGLDATVDAPIDAQPAATALDGGPDALTAPPPKAPPRADLEEPGTGDAGTPSNAIDAGGQILDTAAAAAGQPGVRIPPTEAEKAEG